MSVVAVDDGYDFHVVVLDDTWVVRVPRRPACAEALAVEAALLPVLARALPVRVPDFEVASPFAVYRLIDGTPLHDEEEGVREFLHALHAFEVGDLPVETLTGFEPEHLLCRDGRLIGVIDWGDTRVGDPALDYAWLLNGPLPHWDVDDELRRRARFYHRLAPWFGAHYEVFHGRAPSLDAVRATL